MVFIAVGSILLLTITVWNRFIPLYKLPLSDNVRLVKELVLSEEDQIV